MSALTGEVLISKLQPAIVRVSDMSKVYPNGIRALDCVNLTIIRNEFVFLIGENGAGKSTLIKTLLRMELPTSGRAWVNGKDVARLRRHEIPFFRRTVGVVFQNVSLIPHKTIYENVAFALEMRHYQVEEVRRRVPAVLEITGIVNYADAFPDELSGGELQKAAIARAIVREPALLIADEPTANLSPESTEEVATLLATINKLGVTTLVATHNEGLVNRMNKRVVQLDQGKIVYDQMRSGYPDSNS